MTFLSELSAPGNRQPREHRLRSGHRAACGVAECPLAKISSRARALEILGSVFTLLSLRKQPPPAGLQARRGRSDGPFLRDKKKACALLVFFLIPRREGLVWETPVK